MPALEGEAERQMLELVEAYAIEGRRLEAWSHLSEHDLSDYVFARVLAQEDLLDGLWASLKAFLEEQDASHPFTSADEYVAAEHARMNPIFRDERLSYAAIKEKVDIVDYIGRHMELRPNGSTLRGKCPFPAHSDSTPSFYVYPTTRSFYCFGCHVGGDVITFVQHIGDDMEELA